MNERILIIEDEPSILMGLQDDLEIEGYRVVTAKDGNLGYQLALRPDIDLILLDIMLPGKDGFTICREIRQQGIRTPVIMLTAKGQEVDKVLGLEFGADDYVTKPFSLRELQARVKAQLRRVSYDNDLPNSKKLDFGALSLDKARMEVKLNNDKIELTQLEFEILYLLCLHSGNVVDRYQMLEDIWGNEVMVSTRTIDTHVANLRKKLGPSEECGIEILSIRGVGYKLVENS